MRDWIRKNDQLAWHNSPGFSKVRDVTTICLTATATYTRVINEHSCTQLATHRNYMIIKIKAWGYFSHHHIWNPSKTLRNRPHNYCMEKLSNRKSMVSWNAGCFSQTDDHKIYAFQGETNGLGFHNRENRSRLLTTTLRVFFVLFFLFHYFQSRLRQSSRKYKQ